MSRVEQPLVREAVEATPRKAFPISALPTLTKRQAERCAHCEDRIVTYFAKGRMHLRGYHIDHVLPLELGGVHALSNWQLLCVPCHRAKTREDVRRIAKVRRIRKREAGLAPKKRGFSKRAGMRYDWARGRYVREG